CGQLLADAVRLVQTVEPKPKAREAGAGHPYVADGRRGEGSSNVQAAELVGDAAVGCTGAERHPAWEGKKLGDERRVCVHEWHSTRGGNVTTALPAEPGKPLTERDAGGITVAGKRSGSTGGRGWIASAISAFLRLRNSR